MVLVVSGTFLKVLHILTFCSLVLAGTSYFIFLNQYRYPWRIMTKCPPLKSCNALFYYNFSSLGFGIISFLYAIAEFLLLFDIKGMQAIDTSIVKPIVYIVSGVAVLGLCGDLGIASGSLCIISGSVWLLLALCSYVDD